MNALLLVLATLGSGHWQTIDAFDYPTTADARQAWAASGGTPEVTAVTEGGRRAIQLVAPFAADARLPRTVLDRRASLDLANEGQFTLVLRAAEPQAVGQVSLYFRSGDGWYAAGASLGKPGWQTLEFPKSSFRIEGQPAGWRKIDGIRISFWRGQAKDSTILLRQLAAGWHDVALVLPSAREQDGEQATVRETAANMAQMLAELGLGADTIEDADVVRGGLGKRRVVDFALSSPPGRRAGRRLGEVCPVRRQAVGLLHAAAGVGPHAGLRPVAIRRRRRRRGSSLRCDSRRTMFPVCPSRSGRLHGTSPRPSRQAKTPG